MSVIYWHFTPKITVYVIENERFMSLKMMDGHDLLKKCAVASKNKFNELEKNFRLKIR